MYFKYDKLCGPAQFQSSMSYAYIWVTGYKSIHAYWPGTLGAAPKVWETLKAAVDTKGD